jgi:hypothetical protein
MNKGPEESGIRRCLYCHGTGVTVGRGSRRRMVCSRCRATIFHGPKKGMRKIHVEGTDHSEVCKVARDLSSDNDHKTLFRLIASGTFWIGALLAVLGVVLVIVGASGDTSFTFSVNPFDLKT